MAHVNKNYANIKETYLFTETARRIAAFTAAHPETKVIKMSIGDVTRPLAPEVVGAMEKASREMGTQAGFHGYGPEQGYPFLKEKIRDYYKNEMSVNLDADEIFISDGAKSDIGNITDLFSNDNVIAVPDPVYPVYVDSNVMCGRKVLYIGGGERNSFLPMPEENTEGDIFYLCSPNNPTGSAYTRGQLTEWVNFALSKKAVILFDAAYESFVSSDVPRSIFEIEGAKECAVEFCSFSKTAGFTGTRCGYTVVPKSLTVEGMNINKMWLRRQTTKFNGVAYVVQRAAEAVFSENGMKHVRETIDYYRGNAKIMTDTLAALGIKFTGGVNSPYVWYKVPDGATSWEYFDSLLSVCGVAGTPGSGFGKCGEGYFRLTAFNTRENTLEAMKRIEKYYKK
jgi:LL-diaminopimelate aminotransferase